MTDPSDDIALLGYSDRLSARPGDTVSFKVSAVAGGEVEAWLTRSVSADPNPDGPGIVEEDARAFFAGATFSGRHQPFHPGSYAVTKEALSLDGEVELSAIVQPMLAKDTDQAVLAVGDLALVIDGSGGAALRCGEASAAVGAPMRLRQWYSIKGRRSANGDLVVVQEPFGSSSLSDVKTRTEAGDPRRVDAVATIGARIVDGVPTAHFNGKIEAPSIRQGSYTVAEWKFSQDMSSMTARDAGPNGLHARLVNHPARAMTGANWNGSEMCWRHAPEQYGAIHFHEDDIYDFGWETDFEFTLPEEMPSGMYVMRIRSGEDEDAMPFWVCAPKGKPGAKLCVLIPTFTYTVYGNHARPDFEPHWAERFRETGAYPHNPAEHRRYGLSTYNFHPDGSGICHASHRRPLLNLRPGYVTYGYGSCSGLRHVQADGHLLTWLEAQGIEYDVITDRELHEEGAAAIAGYACVTTTSHPEYHTPQSLNALRDYRDGGGNLMYLGGNGFYWRIALHPEDDGIVEIRRAEDGVRAWASEPGEYYQAFDGGYGGLWRRNGRPPQALAGVGFSAQGNFHGSPYRRACFDPAYDWLFEGVENEMIGDFGLSGGGAAGFELDRHDVRLGSPENAVVLASSEGHGDSFIVVPEEILTHLTNIPGESEARLLRADMVHFEVPGGGSVFSVGSITYCGSLLHEGGENDVSRITRNVIRRMTA